jgi:tetratricopeptide (TPR) repeat protein
VARRHSNAPADTLEELEGLTHRLAIWLETHWKRAAVGATVVLVAAAIAGAVTSWRRHRVEEASAAVAELRRDYVVAMGGQPGDVEVPEPANPERAEQVRNEFVARFAEAGRRYAGTASGAMALLEAGEIYITLGAPTEALALWQEGAKGLPEQSVLRAMLLERTAPLLEAEDRFEEAARAYEAAASVEAYPMRYLALAEAARCWLDAAEPERALAIYQRFKREAPDFEIPAYIEEPLKELALGQGAGAPE